MKKHLTIALAALTLTIPLAAFAPLPAQAADSTAAFVNPPRLRALDFTPFAAELDAMPAGRTAVLDQLLSVATIADLQAVMAAGELSSADLTLYFLQRIRRHDERLRTLVELNPRALDEARAADVRRKSWQDAGARWMASR